MSSHEHSPINECERSTVVYGREHKESELEDEEKRTFWTPLQV